MSAVEHIARTDRRVSRAIDLDYTKKAGGQFPATLER